MVFTSTNDLHLFRFKLARSFIRSLSTLNPVWMSFLLALPCHSPAINEVVFDKTKLNFSKWVFSAQDFKCSAYSGCVADGWNNINANLHNVFANEPAFRRLTYSQCIKITHFVEYVTCTESWDCEKWIRGKEREKCFWINRVMLLKRLKFTKKTWQKNTKWQEKKYTHTQSKNPHTLSITIRNFGNDNNWRCQPQTLWRHPYEMERFKIENYPFRFGKGAWIKRYASSLTEPIGIVGLTKKPHETLNRIWDKHMCVTSAWPCIDSMDYRIMSISISIPTISDVRQTRFYVFTLFTGLYDRFKYLNRDFNSIFSHSLCMCQSHKIQSLNCMETNLYNIMI